MSLTNPNKVVTEQRLSEFYNQILPYLGGMPEAIANKFSKGDLYSTSEKIVGCWIDGKPIYQKVFQCGALSNVSSDTPTTRQSVGATVDKFITAFGYLYASGTKWYSSIPYAMPSSGYHVYPSLLDNGASTNKNTVCVSYGGNLSWVTDTFLIVRYTKTTDSANSFNYANETDYSTTEHIVGTWINGKPLYQKTVDCGQAPDTTEKSVNHGISNIGIITKTTGFLYHTVNGTEYFSSIPYVSSTTSPNYDVALYATKTAINIKTFAQWDTATSKVYVTLQYTKTTD